jgi:hypothetical protein
VHILIVGGNLSTMGESVVFIPRLTEDRMNAVALATACARQGWGRVVRVDYAEPGAFVYCAYCTGKLQEQLDKKGTKGFRTSLRAAAGPCHSVHVLPAKGWERGMRSEAPVVLTDDVITYDVDTPDAGEGGWDNWERKVTAVEVVPYLYGQYSGLNDPYETNEVAMLRCRRWRCLEPTVVAPLAPWRGPVTREDMQTAYGKGLGNDLFTLLRAAGGDRVRIIAITQSPLEELPPTAATVLIGEAEADLRALEAAFDAKNPGSFRPLSSRSPSSPDDVETDDEEATNGVDDGDWVPNGLVGQHYSFDVSDATDDQRAQIEWMAARLSTLVSRWGGHVAIHRNQ